MARIEAKVVDEIPWDIDGLCKFILKCAPEEWQKMTRDGHWFLMNTSGKSTSSYVRKVGHCLGSFVCYNPICSKRLTENVINRINFKHEGDGKFTCGPCGEVAQRVYCGAIKRMHFNKLKYEAFVEHQGTHTCNLKPNK